MAYWLEGVPASPDTVSDLPNPAQTRTSPRLSLLRAPRARRHAAFACALAVIGLISFLAFPARRMALTADSGVVVAVTRNTDAHSLLEAAGLSTAPGDVVVRSGNELRLERAAPVIVEADGRALGWWTHAPTLEQLFAELGIPLGPRDTVTLDGEAVAPSTGVPQAPPRPIGQPVSQNPLQDAPTIAIRRAVPLAIVEDGRRVAVESSRLTLDQVLADAGIELEEGDEVSVPLTAEPTAGMEVEVMHAKDVTLRVGAASIKLRTQKRTVGEVLAEAGYSLGPDDRVEPSVNAPVTDGMTARLVRVAGRLVIEREVIEHKTVFKPDEELAGSATRIVPGQDGVLIREYRIVIEDGVEKEKRFVREYQEPEVRDTVIYYAASTLRAAGVPVGTYTVDREEHVYATWYNAASAGKSPTDPAYGITATGMPLVKGVVAVDPEVIPLGSRLYVPGYGFAVAADTGGGIKGKIIDLGYPDGVPVDWRTGWVDIYVLSP